MSERRSYLAGLIVVGVTAAVIWWPLLTTDGARVWSGTTPDADQFVWSMEHTLKRLGSFQNPFLTDTIFTGSGGANLAYNTAAPGVAVLAAPATLLGGPTCGLAAATIALPVLTFIAMSGLLSQLLPSSTAPVRSIASAVVALSPFIVLKDGHHINLVAGGVAFVFSAWAGTRWWKAKSARAAVGFGAALGLLFWTSTEMLLLGALAAGVALAGAIASGGLTTREAWEGIRSRSRGVMVAAVTGVAVGLPFLSAFLAGPERFTSDYHPGAEDLFGIHPLNMVVPGRSRAISSVLEGDFGPLQAESTGYISALGVIAAVWISLSYRRRSTLARASIIAFWALTLLSLGHRLQLGSKSMGVLPWAALEHLPVVAQAIPNRLSFFALLALVIAGVESVGTARLDTCRSVLVLAALAALWAPARPFGVDTLEGRLPAELARQCAERIVVVTPQRGLYGVTLMQRSMAWQAESGFAFDLARGWAFRSSSPASGPQLVVDELVGSVNVPADDTLRRAASEISALDAGCLVASGSESDALETLLGPPNDYADGWRIWVTD